jgi:glycosyltransferase involved in cell wall biosynthesis
MEITGFSQSYSISVIVVVRNGERFIAQALHSIQEQTHPAHEIIVVDGQSSDRTKDTVSRIPGTRLVEQPELGLAAARNLGLDSACGELVAFLDCDDRWYPEKLAVQVDELAQRPDLDFVTGLVRFYQAEGELPRPGYHPGKLAHDHAGQTPGTLLARRRAFIKVGVFDPAFQIACDADWFVRAADCGTAWAVIPKPVLYKRIHQHNLSAQVDLYRKEWLSVLRCSVLRKREKGI